MQRTNAVVAALMAIGGFAGAVGLIGGGIDFGPLQETIMDRVPLGSPVLAGLALTVAVGLPMTAAALTSWAGYRFADQVMMLAGTALVGWIAIEIMIVRVYSWMQPACVGYGLLVMLLGWLSYRRAHQSSGIIGAGPRVDRTHPVS
ncbi:hypothetical protein GCM10009841_02050 [Microlunatus panaciterrae]